MILWEATRQKYGLICWKGKICASAGAILLLFGAALLVLAGCKKDQVPLQKAIRIQTGTTANLNRILVADSNDIIVAGGNRFEAGKLLVSHDGGQSFHYFDSIPESTCGFYGVAERKGFIYCSAFGCALAVSADRGLNWHMERGSEYNFLKDIAFANDTTLLTISTFTDDSGKIWQLEPVTGQMSMIKSLHTNLNRLRMWDDRTGYACGGGVILKTEDGGRSWEQTTAGGDNFTSMWLRSADEVYVCGYAGSILKTTDGGKTWKRLRNGNNLAVKRYFLNDLCFTDSQHGFAAGEKGAVIYTDDGGEHWMELQPFTDTHLRAIAPLHEGGLLVCGENGELWRIGL